MSPSRTGNADGNDHRRHDRPRNAAVARFPRIARALLTLALPTGFERESVLGDFHEDYARLRRRSPWGARLWVWREAVGVSCRALMARLRRRRHPVIGRDGSAVVTGGRRRPSPPGRPSSWRRVTSRCMTVLTEDVPYAARNLSRAPGFTAVAVLSLALGIAPLAVIGGFVNAAFFRPLEHVQDEGRLVALFRGVGEAVSWPDLVDAGSQAEGLDQVAAISVHREFNLTEGEVTTSLTGSETSVNYFDVLGVELALGRGFAAHEMGTGAPLVVVISHTFWQRHFDGAADALGETLRIDGRDHTVVGIAPEGLLSPAMPVEPQVYVPLTPEVVDHRGRRGLYGIGRLSDGSTLADVRTELEVVQERLRAEYPDFWSSEPGRGGTFAVHPLGALRVPPGQEAQIDVAAALITILGLLVLATACSNLGNLLLARGSQRGGEIAVRRALGADRGTLVTMLLAESVLLGCAGGAVGVLAAHWLTLALEAGRIGPDFALDITVDVRVLAFTAVVSIAAGILFGLVPALRASDPDLSSALRGDRTASGPTSRTFSFRNGLVMAQVAASLALLVSAGVLLRSLQQAQRIDPGYDPDGVVTVNLDLTQGDYSEAEGRRFFEQLAARVGATPGVDAVALALDVPLDGIAWLTSVVPEGLELEAGEQILAEQNLVSAGYFALMRTPVLMGRDFSDADIAAGADVVVINEAMAQRFWPDGALGRRLSVGGKTVEVVGIVRNAKYNQLAESPVPSRVWHPYGYRYEPAVHLVVRARTDARAMVPVIRRLVREADPDLPVLEPRLMTDVVASSSGDQRAALALLSIIGLVSLSLVVVGIYGVVSFVVSGRTHEVGVRKALGARTGDVIALVMLQGMRPVSVGIVAGLAMALGIARLLSASFPGVEPLDPTAPLLATMLLGGAAALATLVPALRASRVDPMTALRAE